MGSKPESSTHPKIVRWAQVQSNKKNISINIIENSFLEMDLQQFKNLMVSDRKYSARLLAGCWPETETFLNRLAGNRPKHDIGVR